MHNFLRHLGRLAVIALVPLLFVACGKGGSGKVNVAEKIEALKSPDLALRTDALADLAAAGPKAEPAIPALIPLLKDPDKDMRRLAAYALGEIGPKAKSAIPELKELLKDGDMSVIQAAGNAMRSIDPSTAGAPGSNVQTQ